MFESSDTNSLQEQAPSGAMQHLHERTAPRTTCDVSLSNRISNLSNLPCQVLMNSPNTTSLPPGTDGGSAGMFSTDRIGTFGYGLGVSIGMLLLITTLTLASYFCTRARTASPQAAASRSADREMVAVDMEAVGIDEATLKNYPKVRYSHTKLRDKGGSVASGCSICLSDYKDSDVLRVLPECGHQFHVKCVDLWLRLHPTCPLCRTSPLPSPIPTPLAEVVPLPRLARQP